MRTCTFVIPLVAALCGQAAAAVPQEPVPARLSLAEALRLAAAQSPSLATARQEASLGQADLLAARQRPNPTASLSSEGLNPSAGGSVWNRQELVVQAEQELELGGRRARRIEAATASLAARQSLVADEGRQVRLRVQQAYYQLALARSEVETSRASLEEMDKLLAVNRARYEQGEVSGGELRRMEVERLKFSDDVRQAELSERQARSALLALLGAPSLDRPLELTDGLTAHPVSATAFDVPTLVTRAIASRPDLESLRHEKERAAAETRLQQALRIPDLTVGAGYRRDFGENGLVVALSVPLPLFDRNAAGIARAQSESRITAAHLHEQEVAVTLEVQQAVAFVDSSRARVADLESAYLQKAREARDAALAAYRAGTTDLIDLLDAQRAYREVQRTHLRARYDYQVGLCALDAAVGSSGGLLP